MDSDNEGDDKMDTQTQSQIFPTPSGRLQRPPPTPSRSQQSTPLAAATPRTPLVALPRGDISRAAALNRPVGPSTPIGWGNSQTSGASPAPDDSQRINQDMYFNQAEPSFIWGTNIHIDQCMRMFEDFIENFTRANDFEPTYLHLLETMSRSGETIMNIDCSHINLHPRSRRLYSHLIAFPHEIIPIMDKVINDTIYPRHIGAERPANLQVRTYGLEKVYNMRDLDPINIDQLISIRGMVVRCSSVIPELKQAFFKCIHCPHCVEVLVEKGRINEPQQCSQCNSNLCMELIHNRCLFSDKQLIRLQESVDEIPEGETPQTVSLFAYDDLVDTVRPGDRIIVTGVYRAIPRKVNPRVRTLLRVYKTFLDTVHFKRERGSAAENTAASREFDEKAGSYSEEQIRAFKAFARQDNVYDKLIRVFAPSIWEMDDVKRGVLCQLFGGTLESAVESNERDERRVQGEDDEGESYNKDKVRLRGDINILLCGDPGTSKSQILSYVHKMSPRGIYTSGKGSSAVGLTASVVRDPETKDSVLESGALVLSDNGICCIDEFDKMSDLTRAILHEAMEQQTVSITKAGIIATLNARTSILASANPVESRYNSRLSVVENIKLPPTLLSRFDLIYLILDKPNAETDRRLARHLVSLYYSESERVDNYSTGITQDFLRDYIIYARTNVTPELSEEAGEVLVREYLLMRSLGNRGTKTITATPRQLESLIRISQALAKMKLSGVVSAAEVEEAVRLMKVATQAAATDPRTGTIDMDLINTGRSAVDKNVVQLLAEEIRRMLETRKGQRLNLGQLRTMLTENTDEIISIATVEEAIRELEGEGLLQYNDRTRSVIIR